MSAVRTRPATRQLIVGAGVATAAALVAGTGLRYGLVAFALPVAAVVGLALLRRPRLATALLFAAVVLGERTDTGFFPFTSALYDPLKHGPTPVECLLALAVLAALLDRLGRGEPVRVGRPLALPLALIALASVAGAVTGWSGGASVKPMVYDGRQLAYLVLVPLLVVNVIDTEAQARRALAFGAALAAIKAVLGVAAVAAGVGTDVDGATITYYEPVANWLVLLVILGVVAAVLARARLPRWLLAATPLLVLSLALSFRRSFWIGALLGLLLVALLGARPLHRRLFVPAALLVAIAVWALSAVGFQAFQPQGPIVQRAVSLQPSKIEVNAEDRYRIDERANVIAAVRKHPVSGLGLAVDWDATHPLPVEHADGRDYTHIVVLWWWMKLGILGLIAYLSFMATCLVMSWQVWRRRADPLLSSAGLAAFAGLAGLVLVETVGSFTGVDARFTVLVGAVAGMLVVMRRPAG